MTLPADDHEAIRQRLARYNFAIDFGDVAEWVACFTPDGAFECSGLPEGHVQGGRHVGPVELAAYAEAHSRVSQGTARHWNWNLMIEGADNQATMKCYLGAQGGTGKSAVLRSIGIYRDRLVKSDGVWLFAERHVTIG